MGWKRFLLFAGLSVLTACGGPSPKVESCMPAESAPDWVNNPRREGVITAVGIARSAGGTGWAKEKAIAHARSKIAQQLMIRVEDMTESFFRDMGLDGSNRRAEEFYRVVSRQVSSALLQGSREDGNPWWDPCTKEVYVLVAMDASAVADAVRTGGASAVRDINLGEKNAERALHELDRQVKKHFDSPE